MVCHQANSRIIDHCIKALQADPARFYQNMDRHGNTSAASIPVALDELAESGQLTPGRPLACIGFGGGLTWGGAIPAIQRVNASAFRQLTKTGHANGQPTEKPRPADWKHHLKLLNEILGTKYPIIQGGMANIATGEFAAACLQCGCTGHHRRRRHEAGHRCARTSAGAKQLTDKPFGVNIMLMHPAGRRDCPELVVEEGVPVVTTGAGNPGKYIPVWKAAGHQGDARGGQPPPWPSVWCKLGVDAVIAEGTESPAAMWAR